MVTVGAAFNVDTHYSTRLFHSTHLSTSTDSNTTNSSETPLACDMAYRFVPTPKLHNSPSYKHNLGGSDERLNRNHNHRSQQNNFDDSPKYPSITSAGFSLNSLAGNFHSSLTPDHATKFHDEEHLSFPVSDSPSGTSTERRFSDGGSLKNNTAPSQQTQQFFDEDDDDSWKICGVCNDKATGYHFNALTCEGCKGFFRRSVKNSKNFTCSYNNQCSITKNNRRQCQACRLRKCIEIGMKKECIMSQDQIQLKKTLVLTNRIKRTAQLWQPMPFTEDQKQLLDTICTAFIQSNSPPDQQEIRGAQEMKQDAQKLPDSPCSIGSSNSSTFLDLIKRISREITERTPSNMVSQAHVLHFTDIMEFSIKEVIKFCKKIPTFMDLDIKDQIALLKSGCTEILFIKANYTYDPSRKALTLGPDIIYTKESFLQGGMSEHYADAYLKFHEDLSILSLNDMEMASLSAIALFSADRADVKNTRMVDDQQEVIALALQAYTENLYKARNRFATMMSFLPKLRTLNALCTHAFAEVHKQYKGEIRPLVAEVQPDSSVS